MMVATISLCLILLAFTFSTEAFSIKKNPLGAPLYMSGEEARALAKNSGSLRTRDQALCQPIAISDLQNTYGNALQQIENMATNMWGGDWSTVTTNPAQFPDNAAQGCYPTDNAFNVIWDAPPSSQTCPMSVAQLFGYAASGNSSSMVQIYQGTSVVLSTTVSKTVTWMVGFSYTLKLQASVAKFTVTDYYTVAVSVSISNTQSSTTSTQQDARTTIQETINCVGPAEVEVDVALRRCTLSGSIDVPVTIDGWVWFFYPTKRNGHFDWALNLDNVDISDLQANMSVSVTGDSRSYGEFVSTCGCKNPNT
jgi:hypothetical protein